jgi:hypothetical protein
VDDLLRRESRTVLQGTGLPYGEADHGTLIVSAGAHVSSDAPSIQLFGYLRHSLVGRGVMLIGIVILALNFIDGLYKLSKVNRHTAWQIVMSLFYIAVSVRLIQLILAFRGSE